MLVPGSFPGIKDYTIPCSLDGGWIRQAFLSVLSLYPSFFPSSGLDNVRLLGESPGPLTCGLSAQPSTLPIWNIHPSFIDFVNQSATTSLSRGAMQPSSHSCQESLGILFCEDSSLKGPGGDLNAYVIERTIRWLFVLIQSPVPSTGEGQPHPPWKCCL